jgi:hypothetical protein
MPRPPVRAGGFSCQRTGPTAVFRRTSASLEEWRIDLLNVEPAILNDFDRVADLDQLAGGLVGVCVGAITGEFQINGSSSGKINSGPLFLTLPTLLSTRQIFSQSSGHGRSGANNSSWVADSSPSHFGQSLSARITGIRLWISAIASFGGQVRTVTAEVLNQRFVDRIAAAV